MTSLLKSSRNALCALCLWAAAGVAFPATAKADWCYPYIFENWSGLCSGAADACMWFSSECEYYCFSQLGGNLCSDSGLLYCQQQDTGDPEWGPTNWCLTSAYCKCTTT